jgi:hypothetical protein
MMLYRVSRAPNSWLKLFELYGGAACMSQGEGAVTLRTPHLAVQQSCLSTSIILELRTNTNPEFQTSQEERAASNNLP